MTMKLKAVVTFLTLGAMSTIMATSYFAYQQVHAADNAANTPLPKVKVATAQKRVVTEWDQYSGRLVAVDEVAVRSRVTGYLKAIHFKDGDMVGKGDLLFSIDPRPFEAALALAKANVIEAQANLSLAKSNLKRSANLVKTNAISQQRFDQDTASLQQAEARLSVAEAQRDQAQLDLEFTQIKAPISGRINNHSIDVGNLVRGDDQNGPALTDIVALDPIHVVFDVDQNAYLDYQAADRSGERPSSRTTSNPVNVSLAGENAFVHKARMDFVSNRIDESTGTIRARALLDNKDLTFTPGMFARVQLLSRQNKERVLIPQQAVTTEQTAKVVFVVESDGQVQGRIVQLGPIVDGMQVITYGLDGDEAIVIAGLHRISHGVYVDIVEQNTQSTEIALHTLQGKE
jgi:multidrug efflux system membrane fusion protein